ncbi:Bcr/CflA family efflux MFS transporter [Arthrobacter crusticola]|uniref:Bcr/CflA family efflux MFS transporter n=1 Tax=Arthrobacter crusticola TaxID=2547960 RepID=A0A4R5U058_9MICC|nr:multidrug effflux MFS transporter [Arthrobacter crusticola]TDK26903.1 Bcr/CflA family efflux MFS transporter [Arthrobacter crusticola]
MTSPISPGDSLSRREKLIYVGILGALTALGPFTIDLYLPAFPALQRDFNVTEAAVQLTLTGTIIGLAVGQLIVGPLSDKVGRRVPLILATSLHVGASIGVALSMDISMLMFFRVLQGVGAAGGGVVALATVRDLFSGYALVRMFSYLALVNGMAPIFAPVIGSQLLVVVDWPGIFWFLAAYGILVIIAVSVFIIETLPRERRKSSGSTALQRYRAVLTDRIFLGVLLVGGMNFSGLFSYLSASPFLFQNLYGLSEQQYGLLFGINSLGIVAGVQISSRVLRRYGPQWVIAAATVVMLVMSLLILAFDQLGLGLWGTAVPLWFYIMAAGFVFPCVQVLALFNHGAQAGTAASILGAVTFGLAGAVSPVVGVLGIDSATPMAVVMAACIALAIVALWTVVRPRSVPALA